MFDLTVTLGYNDHQEIKSMNHSKSGPEKKAKNEAEAIQEMVPFFVYAAIPIIITILIAFKFGPSH